VFTRAAKPVEQDGKCIFHHGIVANPPAILNQRQVLKKAAETLHG
jgi:hypothetical protein